MEHKLWDCDEEDGQIVAKWCGNNNNFCTRRGFVILYTQNQPGISSLICEVMHYFQNCGDDFEVNANKMIFPRFSHIASVDNLARKYGLCVVPLGGPLYQVKRFYILIQEELKSVPACRL